jgi:hypothetical protein
MTTPLTPEEVAKLRLPSWFQLVPISEHQGDLTFEVLCKDKWHGQVTEEGKESSFSVPRSEVILAYLAENIANGHLHPAALDAVWTIAEGKVAFYSKDGDNYIEDHDSECEAMVHAEATFDSASDDESAEKLSNVEYGLLIRLGGSRETGEVTEENGEKTIMFEMVKP